MKVEVQHEEPQYTSKNNPGKENKLGCLVRRVQARIPREFHTKFIQEKICRMKCTRNGMRSERRMGYFYDLGFLMGWIHQAQMSRTSLTSQPRFLSGHIDQTKLGKRNKKTKKKENKILEEKGMKPTRKTQRKSPKQRLKSKEAKKKVLRS